MCTNLLVAKLRKIQQQQSSYCKIEGCIMYNVWHNRNCRTHEAPTKPPHLVTHLAKHFMVEYRAANSKAGLRIVRREDRSLVKWLAPPPGRIKINIDVATGVTGATMVGIVARDHDGYIQMAAGRSYPQSLDPMVGEALAIKAGLELDKAVGMKSIIIESDCQGAVRMLNGPVDLSTQASLSQTACI